MTHYSPPDYDPPRRPRSRSAGPLAVLFLLLFGVGLGAAGFWAGGHLIDRLRGHTAPTLNPEAALREAAPKAAADAEESEAIGVFKGVKPSVVNVDLVAVRRAAWDDKLLEQQAGTGSGFVWDADGRIVTNFHVIAEAGKRQNLTIRVVFPDRTAYDARVVGVAPDYDLAVIQVSAPKDKLKPIAVGTSADLEVGQKAFAIGNPFGLSLTMTKGIISALDRNIESPGGSSITGAIQTDAPINPGNSGGPLLDKSGRLIGVNTSITSPSGGNVGIGFAIPVDTVNTVVTEVIRTGRPSSADLGVRLYDQKKLRRAGFATGVMIEEALPTGAAAKAGLKGIRRNPATGRGEAGDVIVAVNGEEIAGVDDFQRVLRAVKPGDRLTVRIVRDDKEQDVTVVAGGV